MHEPAALPPKEPPRATILVPVRQLDPLRYLPSQRLSICQLESQDVKCCECTTQVERDEVGRCLMLLTPGDILPCSFDSLLISDSRPGQDIFLSALGSQNEEQFNEASGSGCFFFLPKHTHTVNALTACRKRGRLTAIRVQRRLPLSCTTIEIYKEPGRDYEFITLIHK